MQESTTREKVLKKIRKALISKTANPYPNLDFDSPVFRMNDEVPELIFAQSFREAGGMFIFCENMLDFAEALLNLAQTKKWNTLHCTEEKLASFLDQCEFPLQRDASATLPQFVSVSLCECLVARTGSILFSSTQSSGRNNLAYAPVQVVVAYTNQLVDDIKDAFVFMKEKYKNVQPSSTLIVTGPAMVTDDSSLQAYGPGELYLFLIDKQA